LGSSAATGTLGREVRTGVLHCRSCKSVFPIIGGVAILVPDAHAYITSEIKNILCSVALEDIPSPFRETAKRAFRLSSTKLGSIFFSDRGDYRLTYDDLCARKVLKLMKHELQDVTPFLKTLVLQYWDRQPFFLARDYIKKTLKNKPQLMI
jgi:hypothetical protein